MQQELSEFIKLTAEGWRIRILGKEATFMDDILCLEFDEKLGDFLGISTAEAWKLKHELLERWAPRDLDEVRCLFPRIIGEDENVKLLVLALFSLKLREPSERLMGVIIEASNSAGKSHIAREILKPLRPRNIVLEFSRMTGPYLERKFQGQNLDRKILFIQEANSAPMQLHLTLSEGKLYVGLVERIDGELRPVEIECEGQPFLILTAPNWRGSQNLIHRCIIINLDEGREQTLRIINHKSKLNSDLVFRERFEAFAAGCEKIFLRLWESAPENVRVIIPYLPLLVKRFEGCENLDVKLRRDFIKLIALIKASAILFHRRRITAIREVNGLKDVVIVASLEDLENVLPLVSSNMRQVLSSIGEKERRVLEAMRESETSFFNYTELAKLTGIPSTTLRLIVIPRLEAKGYVAIDRDTRPHRIELLRRDLETPDLHIDPAEAKALETQCVESLSMLGYACACPEKTSETASILENEPVERVAGLSTRGEGASGGKELEEGFSEKEPAESVILAATRDLGLFSENEAKTGEISRQAQEQKDRGRDLYYYLKLSEGG